MKLLTMGLGEECRPPLSYLHLTMSKSTMIAAVGIDQSQSLYQATSIFASSTVVAISRFAVNQRGCVSDEPNTKSR